jgi:phage terminase large subunit GpA-like protein
MIAWQHWQQEIIQEFQPPPALNTAEWAQEFRHVAQGISAEPGKWRNERVPYLQDIMNATDNPDVKQITVMKSSQVGLTEGLGLNIVGRRIHTDPCPIMWVVPTLDFAREFSKKRFTRGLIECTPVLHGKIGPGNSKKSDNVILNKSFPGGDINFVGSNSTTSVKSWAKKLLIFDEIDEFKDDVGDQGDIIENALRRTITFSDSLIILISTPTIKDFSRIEKAFNESNKQYYFVPCYKCGHKQRLYWANVIWPKDEPLNAKYKCAECRELWSDPKRWNALQYGEWRAERPEIIDHFGYHLWAAYSPWVRLGPRAEKFLKVKNDPPRFKVFVNQDLGETWEASGEVLEPAELYARTEKYPAEVPAGGLVLTAGIDVQKTWIEGTIKAWGIEQESWLIDRIFIHGDPRRNQIWKELEDRLNKTYQHESGLKLRISAACIDSGYLATQVYKFCQGKENRRIFATKGSNIYGIPVVSKFSVNQKYGVKIFTIGTDSAKDIIFPRLGIEKPGPGYMHFPEHAPMEYFEGLCSEKGIPTYHKENPVMVYKKLRERNEPLDCEVYALAAIEILNPPFEKIKEKLTSPEEEKPKSKKSKKSWINRWKQG